MRFTLRTKVILTVSLFLVVVFVLIMFLSLARNTSQLRSSLNEQSKSFAALATPPIGNVFLLYRDSGSVKINQQVNKYLDLDPDVTSVRVVSVDGTPAYSSQGQQLSSVPANLAATFQPQYLKNKNGFIYQVIQPYFEESGSHRYAVVYDISTKRAEESTRNAVKLILYVGILILILSIAATVWALNALFIRPLRAVSRSANIISAGDYDHQIVSKNRDEIGNLAQSVNKMAETLKGDIEKLREVDKLKSEFLMIASHNLRTPLTVMRGYMEMAEQASTAEELKAIINSIQEGVVRLHLLSEDLLTISTLQSGGEMLAKTSVEAKDFINASVAEFEVLAEKKKLAWKFTNDVPDGIKLSISQSNMRSALGNIIDNAIKFTKEGGAVTVSSRLEDNQVRFVVTDTGIGIQPEEMPKLFTMFHRGTSTMTYDYEGAGIGLYLTKLIVEKHGGRINVQSQPGHGSTFTVYLPLVAPEAAPLPPVQQTPPEPTTGAAGVPAEPDGHHPVA